MDCFLFLNKTAGFFLLCYYLGMKVAIGYPPFDNPKGRAFLGQNRQFQWGESPWTAYPVVPAYAASLLKENGYDVYWLDGIWGMQSYAEWEKDLLEIDPDLLFLETKTPVVKRHWEIIDRLADNLPNCKIVLAGDHVTALPQESFENSAVDYILTGGDYDFLLLNLCEHLSNNGKLASDVLSQTSEEKSSGHSGLDPESKDLDALPFIDRDLTNWEFYAYKNSNYARLPGTYTMFGRDCWWGKCTFCSWTTLYPGQHYRVMSPQRALDEVGHIITNYPIREIMDDSGTFPVGDWLREFCNGMIDRGYNKKVRISCNMRFNSGLTKEDYALMGKAGFRFLLYGLESVNQETLERINKNMQVEHIRPALKWAKKAGLNPHVTVMVGYPWETRKDAENTLEYARQLFKDGLADSLQATIVTPYPGTPLFKEADEKGWLKTKDWDKYDMQAPVLKTPMPDEELKGLVRAFYKSFWSPQFVWRKIKEGLSDWDMFKYYLRFGRKFFSKLVDFH